jgi:uncharacterized membrane protein YhaH (DUF805 family)
MNHASATLAIDADLSRGSGSKRAFARHFGEMLIAMFLGMGVLGGLAALGFGATGGSSSDLPGGVRVMLMGIYMTVPMVLWMKYRGHAAARNVEMALSMMVPTVALGVQHLVMVPAMLGVMLWRYDDYAHPHA